MEKFNELKTRNFNEMVNDYKELYMKVNGIPFVGSFELINDISILFTHNLGGTDHSRVIHLKTLSYMIDVLNKTLAKTN